MEVSLGSTNSSLSTTTVTNAIASPQTQLPTAPVTTTASPAAFSDSRKSWSGLFEATTVTPLSSARSSGGGTGLPSGLSTRHSTRPQSPTRQTRASLGDESMLLLTTLGGDDVSEIILTWRSLQPVRPTHPRGLTNYGNMCFLNAVCQFRISPAFNRASSHMLSPSPVGVRFCKVYFTVRP